MATGYEVGMYRDISSIAHSLGRIATALEEKQPAPAPVPTVETAESTEPIQRYVDRGTWPPDVSLTYQCPKCGDEIDIREAKAL